MLNDRQLKIGLSQDALSHRKSERVKGARRAMNRGGVPQTRSYLVAMITAATLSAALLLAPAPGLGQNMRQLTIFDREGNIVRTIGEPDRYSQPKFSPDRSRVAVIIQPDLWVFDLATGNGTQITSRQRGRVRTPVWSPDGSQLAYVARRGSNFSLYRKASNGGGEEELVYEHLDAVIRLTDWSLDGRFLSFYSADARRGGTLYLLPLDGDGQAIEVARSEFSIMEARLSPDSRFLAYRSNETGRPEIFVRSVELSSGALTSAEQWQVSTEGGLGMASWRQDGRELYYLGAGRSVMAVEVNTAQSFEFGRPRLLFKAPNAIPVVGLPNMMNNRIPGDFGHASRDGERVVFAVPPPPQLRRITVFDREGNVVSRLGDPGLFRAPRFSPDGSRVAVIREDLETGNVEVWTFDVSTGEGMRVTTNYFQEFDPVWSPDGTHVAYVYNSGGYERVYRKAWNGEGSEELLFRYSLGTELSGLTDFSADGRFLAFDSGGVLLVVPLTGTDPLAREAIEFVREEFEAFGGWFSPDSRFIAYHSNESGRFEIYVRPFDASSGTAPTDEKWPVPSPGAFYGSWRQDGQELLYLSLDRETSEVKVMAVDVATTPEFQVGTPQLLFRLQFDVGGHGTFRPDGQRFVFAMPAGGP